MQRQLKAIRAMVNDLVDHYVATCDEIKKVILQVKKTSGIGQWEPVSETLDFRHTEERFVDAVRIHHLCSGFVISLHVVRAEAVRSLKQIAVKNDTVVAPCLRALFSSEESKHVSTDNPGELLRRTFGSHRFLVPARGHR